MNSDILPGYLLKVTTWENDADNYATTEFHYPEPDHIDFIIAVCKMFRSTYSGGKYGNSDRSKTSSHRRDDEDLIPDLLALVYDFKSKGKLVPVEWDFEKFDIHWTEEDPGAVYRDYCNESLWELIGTWNDGEYWRVFESYQVFEIPIIIKNVTKDFTYE